MASYVETSDQLLRKVIQPRSAESHKGDNGVVCVVGGSRIFHGAPYFSSMAALRTGADLVYLAVPNLIAASIRSLAPELIIFPIADAKLTKGAADALLKWLPEIDSLVVGPGLGRLNAEGLKKIIGVACLERRIKASFDAEAQNTELFNLIKGKGCIATPHPGEFKRVFGKDAGESLEEKIVSTRGEAASHGITIVLNGLDTVISDGDAVYVNKSGSPAMTCGGIGDILSGVIGSLLAQSRGTDLKSVDIAAAASFIVGNAGKVAASIKGFHIVASDIIDQIPQILKPFDRTV
ncbi:MAG: NAD(P)H-hydrate dehydratase [Nitrososphaerota archaeon]|nr:NAD(P)H-hydrate dehydratase [Nitrososphaerota archaeon]